MGAVEGTMGYMFVGFSFLALLFIIGSIGHAAYVPHQGDVLPCNSIKTIVEKHVILDSWGLYDCSASFTDGTNTGIDCEAYDSFPRSGSIYIKADAIRMRQGYSIDAWLPITVATSNVQNACVVTSGDLPPTDTCQNPVKNSSSEFAKTWDNSPDYVKQGVCFMNSTFGGLS